ncbi:hypothetical protein AB3N61_06000 [Leptospira sp. WS58.C1]|uniref:LIC_11090 family protein n=1 Tax=Leptospira TaxID=171 RepID=UPI0002BFEA89|nr:MULTISPECIES: hypothetical protein [unclassified Leptospira]EMK02233.1 hypothetical protein LEP1GSC192_2100 [Leptospira sp. B5-022]MCR1793566.1 hypothetical protein [Leptospira sp. id769339]
MKTISIILTQCFLFQSLVFGSGWFCGMLAGEIKLCHCNHGSQKEKHSASEDQRFSSKLADAGEDHSNSKPSSLPDCHSAKSGEAHKCACKKAKDKASYLSGTICTQFFTYSKLENIAPQTLDSELLGRIQEDSGVIVSFDLERPPRFS